MIFPLAFCTVRKLKPTFFKVVDMSGNYRPLVYETDKWPVPNASYPADAGPYDTSHQMKCRRRLHFLEEPPSPPPAKRKAGYCECCAIRYQDLEMVCFESNG